jgi:hypothetical protein
VSGQLGFEVCDQQCQAIACADALQQLLPHCGGPDEDRANEICHNVGIFQVQGVPEDGGHGVGAGDQGDDVFGVHECGGWGKGKTEFDAALDKVSEFLEEWLTVVRRGGDGAEGADAMDAVRFISEGRGEADADEALQDDVGGAVGMLDGHSDKAQAGDLVGCFALAAGLLHGHDQHSVGLEDVDQHAAVAGLEDIKGQQRLGKEGRRRQGHHRYFARYDHRTNLEADRSGARGLTAGTGPGAQGGPGFAIVNRAGLGKSGRRCRTTPWW